MSSLRPVDCQVLEAGVEEHDDQGYLFKRLGEITFGTAQQEKPSPAGSQQTLVAAATLGFVAFADSRGA